MYFVLHCTTNIWIKTVYKFLWKQNKKKCRGFFYKNQWYNKSPLGDFNKNLNISENQLNLGSKEKKWVSPQWKLKKKNTFNPICVKQMSWFNYPNSSCIKMVVNFDNCYVYFDWLKTITKKTPHVAWRQL